LLAIITKLRIPNCVLQKLRKIVALSRIYTRLHVIFKAKMSYKVQLHSARLVKLQVSPVDHLVSAVQTASPVINLLYVSV